MLNPLLIVTQKSTDFIEANDLLDQALKMCAFMQNELETHQIPDLDKEICTRGRIIYFL